MMTAVKSNSGTKSFEAANDNGRSDMVQVTYDVTSLTEVIQGEPDLLHQYLGVLIQQLANDNGGE